VGRWWGGQGEGGGGHRGPTTRLHLPWEHVQTHLHPQLTQGAPGTTTTATTVGVPGGAHVRVGAGASTTKIDGGHPALALPSASCRKPFGPEGAVGAGRGGPASAGGRPTRRTQGQPPRVPSSPGHLVQGQGCLRGDGVHGVLSGVAVHELLARGRVGGSVGEGRHKSARQEESVLSVTMLPSRCS
jgi:hypothetical protein